MRQDTVRCQQLLMRGANVNYSNRSEGKTPLHIIIEKKMPVDLVKWLLKAGGDPHIEDRDGIDCCDKARQLGLYQEVKVFWNHACTKKPQLRTIFNKNVI